MKKIACNIYRLSDFHFERKKPKIVIQDFIDRHNENNNFYQGINCQELKNSKFQVLLYVHKPKIGKPNWLNLLTSVVENNNDLKGINSQYPSFVMFFYNGNECYSVTGGAGHKVIESLIDNQFGFSVVERLIDANKDDVRKLAERAFLGVELASNRFFKSDFKVNDDNNFGKFYKGVDVFIDKKKLASIGIQTDKNKLLVKGQLGFKIDTKITFDELLNRIKQISILLKNTKPKFELNPFKKVTRFELKKEVRKDKTLEQYLNQDLYNQYFDSFQKLETKDIYHPKLNDYLKCSTIIAELEKENVEIETSQNITPRLIMGKLGVTLDNLTFPRFLQLISNIKIWIFDDERSEKTYPSYLEDWFFGEAKYADKNYVKFENEWYNYTINFSEDLNKRLEEIKSRCDIKIMNPWSSDLGTEGEYNDEYSTDDVFIVADGLFHKNIEVADLISWNDYELILYHVKSGLDRDLRVLQSQVINSLKVISEFKTNTGEESVKKYYEKLKTNGNNIDKIPTLNDFKNKLDKKKIRFVFGFATKTNNSTIDEIFDEIKASQSLIAKISVLHTFYTVKQYDFEFSISKIVRNS